VLPEGFRFTQGNLQDYADCPRRFQLRYLEGQPWPGVELEPPFDHERYLDRGARFHRLVERHQLGVDPGLLEASLDDPDLLSWWRAYLGFEFLHTLGGRRYPEFSLSVLVRGVPLVAIYDLLVVLPDGRVVIFDWKTFSSVPSRGWFRSRLQTRVYLYALARAGGAVIGGSVVLEQVSMVYWVASVPSETFVFEYSEAEFRADGGYLEGLVGEVVDSLGVSRWPLTVDEARCRFCVYRSLCGRGRFAGSLVEVGSVPEEVAFGGVGFFGDLVSGLGSLG
jgi:RecB family exonuclease